MITQIPSIAGELLDMVFLDTSAADRSDSNNDGTPTDLTVTASPIETLGHVTGVFNGTSTVVDFSSHLADFTALEEGTIFVRWASTSTSGFNPLITISNTAANTHMRLGIGGGPAARQLVWQYVEAGTTIVIGAYGLAGEVNDGTYNDAIVRVTSGGIDVLINGEAPSSTTYSTGSAAVDDFFADVGGADKLTIGLTDSLITTNYFTGNIDRVRVFNRGLTDAECVTCRARYVMVPLLGQSNMIGQGQPIEAGVGEPDEPNDRVLMLDYSGDPTPPARYDTVELAEDPLNHTNTGTVTMGLGLTLGKRVLALLADPYLSVLLVGCGEGGSGYADSRWGVGEPAYNRAVARVNDSIILGGYVFVWAWHQGEADSTDPTDAANHQAEFEAMVNALRGGAITDDAAGDQATRLWIAGQMFPDIANVRPDAPIVTAGYRSASLENYKFVSSEGLSDNGDDIHFDADSLRELGERYADAIATSTPYTRLPFLGIGNGL